MKSIPALMLMTILGASAAANAVERGELQDCGDMPARRAEAATPPRPPAPPAPPVPPPLPEIPKAAHSFCAGKPVGAEISYSPRKGATMRGTCQKDSRGMYKSPNAC